VTTDLDGKTNILGLFSAGEAARTGLHGGNRLASTSLLEGLVYGAAVADFVGMNEQGREVHEVLKEALSSGKENSNGNGPELSTVDMNSEATIRNAEGATALMTNLRRIMWDSVGVVRTPSSLDQAVVDLGKIREEACDLFNNSPTLETAGIRDAAYSGEAVAKAALANKVSAGAHCVILDGAEVSQNVEEMSESYEETRTVAVNP